MASNVSVINATYDLTQLFSAQVIEDPVATLHAANSLVGGWMIPGFLLLFGLVLFLIMRFNNVSDTEAGAYAGIITSFLAVLLFVVDITAFPGTKLIAWQALIPFFVITGIFLVMNTTNRRW